MMGNLEKAGRLLRLIGWISLVGMLGIIAAVAIPALSEGRGSVEPIVIALLALAIPLLYLKTGSAIKQGKKWAKVTGTVISIIALFNVPIGTIFGVATLFYLKKGWGELSGDD